MLNGKAGAVVLLFSLVQAWEIQSDGSRLLSGFNGRSIEKRMDRAHHIRIIDSTIGTIVRNTFPVRSGTTNASLEIVNTHIGSWHANQLNSFAHVTIVNSSIQELDSGGISVKHNAGCDPANQSPTVRITITNTNITRLRHGGLVLEAAAGSLHLDRCSINTLEPGGVQLAFRVLFRVTRSDITLQPGAFCHVCSDIVHFRDNRVTPGSPAAAALSFGSPACRNECPLQRLTIRHIAGNSLPCSAVQELRQPLRQCQLRQPVVSACGDGGGVAGEAEDSSGAACGDLQLFVNSSDCWVNSAQLLQLLEPAPWWTEPAVGVTGAVALAVGFLAGLLTLRFCCRWRHVERVAVTQDTAPASVSAPPPPTQDPPQFRITTQMLLRRLRNSVNWLRDGRNDSRITTDHTVSLQHIYEQPMTEGRHYEQMRNVQAPAPPLPRPPSTIASTAKSANGPPRSPALLKVLPTHLYDNLHGTKGREKR